MSAVHQALIQSPLEIILSRVPGAKQTAPGRFKAICPIHEDRSPSFYIKECDDGRILINCFAGCDTSLILKELNLTFSDLFPQVDGRKFDASQPKSKIPRFSARELLPLVVIEAYILRLSYLSVRSGVELSPEDEIRAEQAMEAVERVWLEVQP